MNARFLASVNGGYVTLTIRRGQTIEHIEGGPDDEGYSYRNTVWGFDGNYVTRSTYWDSRDCDGRMSGYAEEVCPVGLLKSIRPCLGYWSDQGEVWIYGPRMPEWELIGSSRRDYSAEASGY